MASIDERVVSMAFENSSFESKVAVTMGTLGKLDVAIKNIGAVNGLGNIEKEANKVTLAQPLSALDKIKAKLGFPTAPQAFADVEKASSKVGLFNMSSAIDKVKAKLGFGRETQAFAEVERASDKVTLGGMSGAIDGIVTKFGFLQTAGVAALGAISAKAALVATGMAKDLSLGPLTQGFEEYSTNLNSIQTILANTEFQGSTLKDVNGALAELNKYSDQTIYNFSEMAKNIGTFTAAGVDLDKSTSSIKGIANLAALSGSNSQQASTAMYQLSQAIASGRVSLQDWNSVVNAGMGGATFQRALVNTAKAFGNLEEGAVKIDKATGKATINGESFRESITAKPGQKSWLDDKVLTETLSQFTGDMTKAELAAKGFNAEQIKSIQQTATTAKKAATEVKTIKGVFDVVKESIGSGWAATFQLIFGDFEEAKKTFTDLTNFITKFTGGVADARNKMLKDWKDLGGRAELIEGIKNAFKALIGILKPVKDAFRDIFPAKTGKDLFELTQRFADFTKGLIPGAQTIENLRRTFRGFFAVLHIGWTVIKLVASTILDLLGVVGKGSGGFLNFTGGIGDMLVAFDKALTQGGALKSFFKTLGAVLKIPLALIGDLASAISSLFGKGSGEESTKFADSMSKVEKALGPLAPVADRVVAAWEKLKDIFESVGEFVEPIITGIANALKGIGGAIAEAFNNIDLDKVLAGLQTGLLAGILVYLKKFLSGGINVDVGGGFLGGLKDALDGLTGTLGALQKNLQAGTLMKIGLAIAALAAGILILSTIDPDKLEKAMTATAIGLGQLVGAMALLTKVGGAAAFVTVPAIAASMILLSTALIIMAGAMKIMATMKWEEIGKGLAGIGGALASVGLGLKFINPVSIIPMAAGITLLGIALNILGVAVKMFATLSWEEMAKGLLGLAGALTALGVGLTFLGPSLLLVGPGLIAAAFGVTLLAGAVGAFGNLKLETLAKGILGAAAAVVALGLATALLPPTLALQAAGLIVLGAGLTALAGAVALFGSLKLGTLVKGIAAIGGSLVTLAFGLALMTTAIPGTIALLGAAAAFAVLGPTLAFLGTLEWSTIFKGLATIGLTLGVIAVAGLVAAPALLALGGALAILGLGLVTIAGAVYLASKGISLLGETGPKAVGTLVAALTAFVALLPTIVINFVKGLVQIISSIADVAPKVAEALGKIINTMLSVVIEAAPKLAEAAGSLILAFLVVIQEHTEPLIRAGWQLLMNFLKGVRDNIGQVISTVADIIVKFLEKLTTELPRIVSAGANLLSQFLLGITNSLPKVIERASKVVTTFLTEITRRMPDVIAKGARLIVIFLNSISERLPAVIRAGVNVIVKFINGIADGLPRILAAGTRLVKKFLIGIGEALPELVDAGFKTVIKFLNGIAKAIRQNDDELIAAGHNIADAIKDGFIKGIQSMIPDVGKYIDQIAGILPKGLRKKLGISSPSKVFQEIGVQTMAGLTLGLQEGGEDTRRAVDQAGQDVINTAGNKLGQVPDMLAGMLDLDPTIKPVLDLSAVEAGAKKMEGLTTPSVVATVSADTASDISAQTAQARAAALAENPLAATVPEIKLEQNNYSPESLSDTEIYRQTKNQLSQLKNVLGLPNRHMVQYSA